MATYPWGDFSWGDAGTKSDVAGTTATLARLYPAVRIDVFNQMLSGAATTTAQTAVKFGEIYPAGDVDFYRVDLTAGTRYEFVLSAGDASFLEIDPRLALYRSDGVTQLFSTTVDAIGGLSSVASAVFTATTSGTYFLSVSSEKQAVSDPLATGAYYVHAAITSGSGTATPPSGTSGDDRVLMASISGSFDAGAGRDTVVFFGDKSDWIVVNTSGGLRINDLHTLTNVERLEFADGILAFDLDGDAGQSYRIYQAAFAREPDSAGLSYWVGRMDDGMELYEVARRFLDSNEFRTIYGQNPSTQDFVDRLYNNILERDGEQAGVTWWTQQLETGAYDRAHVLASFSESPENIALVAPAISDGIWLV